MKNCFEDTIGIFKNVDGVISTDTSLVHLAANLDVPTYVLLTIGSEWRWNTNTNNTNWYQTKFIMTEKSGNWESVIECLITQFNY